MVHTQWERYVRVDRTRRYVICRRAYGSKRKQEKKRKKRITKQQISIRPYRQRFTVNSLSRNRIVQPLFSPLRPLWRCKFRPGRLLAMLAIFLRFCGLYREGTVETCRMTRRCRFDVWNARCGLQSFLDVNRVVHTRWWHTWKAMANTSGGKKYIYS